MASQENAGAASAAPAISTVQFLRELHNEIDCRIEHGVETGGHLEYVRTKLAERLAIEEPQTMECPRCLGDGYLEGDDYGPARTCTVCGGAGIVPYCILATCGG